MPLVYKDHILSFPLVCTDLTVKAWYTGIHQKLEIDWKILIQHGIILLSKGNQCDCSTIFINVFQFICHHYSYEHIFILTFTYCGVINISGIVLFLAVKCNEELPVLQILADLGAGFDCANKVIIIYILTLILLEPKVISFGH